MKAWARWAKKWLVGPVLPFTAALAAALAQGVQLPTKEEIQELLDPKQQTIRGSGVGGSAGG